MSSAGRSRTPPRGSSVTSPPSSPPQNEASRAGSSVSTVSATDVPAGVTVTYTELARRAGHPTAARAAASACARNAPALFVPCHRVVRNDGTLGGFRWGLDVKRWLLAFEAAGS